jgi:hypothetical protein
VSQITETERTARIQQLLAELHKVPPEKHETVRMPWTGGDPLLNVIRIGVDEVLLNPQSHRIRAQLQDDPEWHELSKNPYTEPAQRVIERHVREARKPEEFSALRESLISEGQSDPGVMTHAGLLINANTRVVALRTVEDPAKRYVRVAVLPPTAQADELALLELRLQMQKELKVEYTPSNELLFIEELSVARGLSPAQIARELRIKSESTKKGETEVLLRLKLLDLIRVMQRIPARPLPLTFFDRIKLEQLREVHRVYTSLVERDQPRARRHLESFLLSIAVGIKAVHEIRQVDADFMADYMLPHLEEDETVGPVAAALVAGQDGAPAPSRPPGVDALAPADAVGESAEARVDAAYLVDVITSRDKRVEVPGTNVIVDRDEVKDALNSAVKAGVNDKKRVQRDEDQLAAPSNALKQATQQITSAKEALLAVQDDPEFDERRRKTLEAAHKKLARTCRDFEATLVKTRVIGS